MAKSKKIPVKVVVTVKNGTLNSLTGKPMNSSTIVTVYVDPKDVFCWSIPTSFQTRNHIENTTFDVLTVKPAHGEVARVLTLAKVAQKAKEKA